MNSRLLAELADVFFNGRPAPRTAELEALRIEVKALRAAGDRLAHQLSMSDKAVSPWLRGWWKARGNRCTVCEPVNTGDYDARAHQARHT